MPVLIKVCGISTETHVNQALALGADMVGFVFFKKSPRHLEIDQAANLSKVAGKRISTVLLTVDATDELLSVLIDSIKPQILQLHGSETPERTQSIRQKFCVPVMKSIGIKDDKDIAQIFEYEPVSDFLLLDGKSEPEADRPGGNGIPFDWALLSKIRPSKTWFIAGGLNSSNVGKAIQITGACGVDVSSGVEREAGIKDSRKMEEFVREVRKAEDSQKSHII